MIGAKGKQGLNRESMEGVPGIVRQRLQDADEGRTRSQQLRPDGPHPEAEVLTAFAEQSLAECERAQVFDHLAQCGDCRDVVFLAAPQTEPVQVLQKIPARGGWLSWPVLRWGVLGACGVIVGAAVMFHYESGKVSRAHQETSAPVIIAKEISPVLPEDHLATRADIKIPEQKLPEQEDKLPPKMPTTVEPPRHASSAAPKFPMQFDGPPQAVAKSAMSSGSLQGGTGNAVFDSKPSLSQGARLAKSGSQALKKDNEAQEQKDELEYLNPDEKAKVAPGNSPRSYSEQVEVTGAAPTVETESAALTQVERSPETSQLAINGRNMIDLFPLASSPRWMLTSAGALQRSLDQGHTWERVPVASNVSFHALSVDGAEIWVGGPAGALYHSTNSGQNWVRVIPSSDGNTLTTEITKIEFPSPQQGTLTASSGEVWSTSDAGKTWRKK